LNILNIKESASLDEIREAYLFEAKRHHPDVGGSDPAHFQAIHEAYETVKKFKMEELKKSKKSAGETYEDEEPSEVHISAFGPSENDFILAGDNSDFQSKKTDIYKALRIQDDLNPIIYADYMGHGFIEFLKCNPDIVHGFTDLYSLYLSRIYQTDIGILFELEDFLEEKTRYMNLFHNGNYHYSIHNLQNLEFEGLDRAVYISPDFPIEDNIYGIHPIIDEIIDFKNK